MVRFIQILCCSLLLLSAQVIADDDCSDYMGRATINETLAGNSGFIEIKLLDVSITPDIYNNWSVQACESHKKTCSGALLLLNQPRTNDVYIVVPTYIIPNGNKKYFDVRLIDNSGSTIDYLSYGGYAPQKDNDCTLAYDWEAPATNSHNYQRIPDGIGDWVIPGSGNSGGNTKGGSNEGDATPALEFSCEETFPLTHSAFIDSTEKNNSTPMVISSTTEIGGNNENNFGVINVTSGGELSFSDDFNDYYIEQINVLENKTGSAILNFKAGNYYIGEFESYADTTINIIGSGKVRIFLRDHSDFEGDTDINEGGDFEQLLIYGYDKVHLKATSSMVGFINAIGDLDIKDATDFYGKYYSGGNLKLTTSGTVTDACSSTEPPILGDYCAVTFVNGATSHDASGKIKYEGTSTIFNDPTGNLAANKFDDKGTLTCDGFGDCSVTGTATKKLDLGNFYSSSSAGGTHSVSGVDSLGAGGENDFKTINLLDGGELTFAASSGVYRIEKFESLLTGKGGTSESATLNFTAGDYYIGTFDSYANTTINIVGGGTVRIFLQNHSDFENNTKVNIDGNVEDLLIYGWAEVHIKGLNTANSTEIKALVYSQGKIEIKDQAKLHGAASAGSEMKLKNGAEIHYECAIATTTPVFSCDTTFTDGATSHSSTGSINFVSNTFLYQGSDTVLASPAVNNNGWAYSCRDGNVACSASGSATTKINLPTFETTNNSATLTVENGIPQTIGNNSDNEYETITLNAGGALTTSNAQSTYKITNLISNGGTLWLSPGEYWVENFSIATATLIYLNEPGEVKFYVKNNVTVGSFSEFNKSAASDYKLIFVGYSDISVGIAARIDALIYAQGDITLQNNAHLVGATSASNISFEISSRVNYQCGSITPTVDHYQIIHDGNGLTCDTEKVTIKACTSSIGDTCDEPTENISLDLIVTGVSGHVVTKSVTFTGQTDLEFGFNYTIPEQVTLSIANETISATNGFICNDNSSGSCNMQFADAGFKISGFNDIEIAGVPNDDVTIQAVQTNTNTGVCEPLFINENNVLEIQFAIQAVTPAAMGGLAYKMGTVANHVDIDKNVGVPTNYKGVSLTFDTSSTATLPENVYLDAGIINLHARYTIAATAENPEEIIYGESGNFTVRPNAFRITPKNSADELLTGNTSSASITQKAGVGFDLLFEAINADWYGDGNPDKTVNYTAIDVDIALQRIAPNPGSEGLLTDDTGLNVNSSSAIDYLASIPFSFGQYQSNSKTAKFSEVGVYQLHLIEKDTNSPDNTTGNNKALGSQDFGRFIPDHFVLEKIDGDLAAYCDNDTLPEVMPFAYSGQVSSASPSTGGAIRYEVSLNPSFTITAKSINSNTTLNYTGDFMKLVGSNITRLTPTFDYSKDGSLGTKLALTADLKTVTTSDLVNDEALGVVTYSYKDDDNFFYHHELNAETNKFTTDINLTIVSVIDEDGVIAKDADGDFDGGDPTNALDSVLTLEATGVEIRFGRANIENSYGPETSSLPQALSVEYFENGNYILAADDICSLYNTNKISFGTLNEVSLDEANINPVDGKFDDALDPPNGLTRQIVLPAAGSGNQGSVEVIYTIYDWLKYDWTGDGNFTDDPSATATFGIFRGNDRIIYQREIAK